GARNRFLDGQGRVFSHQQQPDPADRRFPRRGDYVRAARDPGCTRKASARTRPAKQGMTTMAEHVLSKPDPDAFDNLLRQQALARHAKDTPPTTRKDWQQRRARLREAMFAAMGPFPDQPCPLEPKVLGGLERDGYRIEKLIFQSRPDVWVTANAY